MRRSVQANQTPTVSPETLGLLTTEYEITNSEVDLAAFFNFLL